MMSCGRKYQIGDADVMTFGGQSIPGGGHLERDVVEKDCPRLMLTVDKLSLI